MAVADTPTKLLLIVSGGIAAYKAPDLVRKLIAVGFEVQVIATSAALAFCTELSLATVSGRPVRTSLLDPAQEGSVGHIELADWPDLVLVAPATADLMARAAHGLGNDLATTVLLATVAPVLWAPAMNTNMWRHLATQANLATLSARGASFCGPDRGELACGWVGEGRMIDPPVLAAAARALADGGEHPELRRGALASAVGATTAGPPSADWRGRRVLVTAGPTRAYLDPVRFLSNASTGVMGFRLAEAAVARGASVTLIAGPVGLDTPAGVERVDVETGAQMLAACRRAMNGEDGGAAVDAVIKVAAVADLVPERAATEKVDKGQVLESLATMTWRSEVDILATLVAEHGERTRFLGFGAQTVDGEGSEAQIEARLVALGEAKRARKGCDALFVNRVGVPNTGFGTPTNAGVLIFAGGEHRPSGPPRDKGELAGWMLDALAGAWWGAES